MNNLLVTRNKEIKEYWECLEKEIDKQIGEVRGIFEERRKSMTVAELKQTISKMPNDVEVTADENKIKKITATLNTDGDVIAVNIEI